MAKDADLLTELHDRYDTATNEWADIRAEGTTDMRVLSGDVWNAMDPAGAKQRRDAKRPMLSLDELGQYINQVVNDIRANPIGIKFAATGNGANDKGATFYANKMREIEYRSHATFAYTSAFENAIQRGYGFARLRTKYVQDQVFDRAAVPDATWFNQDLWIDGFPNPDMVLPDPYAQRPDLSDMSHCFVLEWRPTREFRRDFPKADVTTFTAEVASHARDWFTPDLQQLLIAEYWKKERTSTETLFLLKPTAPVLGQPPPPPRAVYRKDLTAAPSSDEVLSEREVAFYAVTQYLTNGVEILKTTPWPGEYIPIAGCFGKVLYLDEGQGAKRQLLSMTRLARDPFLLYCYYRTCEAELIGMTPKFPYFVYEGQLSPENLALLAKSLHEPVAVIPVKPTVEGLPATQPLGFPQRNPYEPPIQALEMGAEAARRAIQAAMGISPLPTEAQRHNQKSGVALKQIESSGQRGSFHFVDHYQDMVRQLGVMAEDLMDKIYDTTRKVGTHEADGSSRIVTINDPSDPESVSTRGDYQVTVSTGPSFESERAEASEFADTLIGSPMVAQVAGPKAAAAVLAKGIRLKNLGPIGDQIAELIEPPEFKQREGQPALPPEAQQAMAENAHLKQQLTEAGQIIQTKQQDGALAVHLKEMDLAFQREKLQRDSETKLSVAELGAKVDRLTLFLEERGRLGLLDDAAAERDHAAALQQQAHAHDVGLAAMQTPPAPSGEMEA